jgi:predicted RNase H-like HicB family nuclease
MTYTVIYEKGPASWGAYVPELSGVISVGDSRDEVERLIHEAFEFHLEGMREEVPEKCRQSPAISKLAAVLIIGHFELESIDHAVVFPI